MVILLAAGALSYMQLGRAEDPDFTFKIMIVRANWPGATAREVEQQVTDKIEKKLQETPFLNYVMSYSKPAERSEEHTSELQSLMRISSAVFCLNKTKKSILHPELCKPSHTIAHETISTLS